jgi:SAM-dependent methyltransferase
MKPAPWGIKNEYCSWRVAIMSGNSDYSEYYDADHDITLDIDFYRDYAQQCGSPILELACGTGRVTIPMAEAGFEITGLDNSAEMLSICHQKVEALELEDRVTLVEGEMAGFDLPNKEFALAFIALRSFMLLLDRKEQRSCVECVRDHLRPDGLFILHVIAPDPKKLARMPGEPFALQREFDLANGIHVVRKDRLVQHDRGSQVRHFEFLFEEFDADGVPSRRRVVDVITRYILRDEMQNLLELAGFEIVNWYRDFNKKMYSGRGEMIVVAKRADG